MTDPVETLLRRAMEDEATRAPALGDLAGAARGRLARRRRRMFESAAALTVVVAMVAGVGFFVVRGNGQQHPVAPVDTDRVTAPPGTRLVGFGHAAIAVPKDWGINKTQCGTPTENTVITEAGFARACLFPYPAGVQSVSLWQGKPPDFVADETIEIDGASAQRQLTACDAGPAGSVHTCRAGVYIPSLKVGFRAETTPENAEALDTILSRIRIVPDQIGVPPYLAIVNGAQAKSGQRYLEALQAVGLQSEVRYEKQPGSTAGFLLGVSPTPGTMVAPGSVVTVTLAGPAEGVKPGDTTGSKAPTNSSPNAKERAKLLAQEHPCRASQIEASARGLEAATQMMAVIVELHNVSDQACGLVGPVAMRLEGGSGSLRRMDAHSGQFTSVHLSADPVDVEPGGSAYFYLWKEECSGSAAYDPSTQVAVDLSGGSVRASLPKRGLGTIEACVDADDPGRFLHVSVYQSTGRR